jgi:hypothetical protein
MAYPEWIDPDERQIIDAIITSVLGEGLSIAVNDGEEFACAPTIDRDRITKEVAATDVTTFYFYRRPGWHKPATTCQGWVTLIHGNGCDVIHDHSDTEQVKIWLHPAVQLADLLSMRG